MNENFTNFSSILNISESFIIEEDVRDPIYILIPITLLYVIIFASSVIGNISTCIVIFHNRYMHTATNYYLFSLAISDLLLVLTGLPKEVYEIWFRYMYIFGEATCILQGFMSETAANATVLTITMFTVERYVAICYPFLSHKVSKLSRALKHIIIIWILALLLAVPQAIQFGILKSVSPDNISQRVECTVKSEQINAFMISSMVFFVVPVCIISVLYVLIGLQLRSSRLMNIKQSSISSRGTVDRQSRGNQTRVIRMLVAVVVAFIICWAPFHGQRLLALYAKTTTNLSADSWIVHLYVALTYVSGIFYFLSATVNPILYNIMSHRFRHAFKVTFGNLCCCMESPVKYNATIVKSPSVRTNHHNTVPSTPKSTDSYPKEDLPLFVKLVNIKSLAKQDSTDSVVNRPEFKCLIRGDSIYSECSNNSIIICNNDDSTNNSHIYKSNNNNSINNDYIKNDSNNDNNRQQSRLMVSNKNDKTMKKIAKDRSPIMVIKNQLQMLSKTYKQNKGGGAIIKRVASEEHLVPTEESGIIKHVEIIKDVKCNSN